MRGVIGIKGISSSWRSTALVIFGLLLAGVMGGGLEPVEGSWTGAGLGSDSPPQIDGIVAEGEWERADPIVMPYSNVRIQSDYLYLYLLIDFFGDTVDDPAGDSFALFFDLDNDGQVTPDVDLVYTPESDHLILSYYLSAYRLGQGMVSTRSRVGVGFGSTTELGYDYPKYRFPHRIWELALSLEELGVEVGDEIGFGLKIVSKAPRISYGDVFDFSRLTHGRLVAARRFAILGEVDWMETSELIPGSDEYRRSRSVALLELRGGEWCTGFLVAEDILWTATHCLGDLPEAELEVRAVFNWEERVAASEREAFICDEILAGWPEPGGTWGANDWGVTLLKCQPGPVGAPHPQDPGERWGVLQLCDKEIEAREPIYLIHQNECWSSPPGCELRKRLTDPDANPNKKISFGVIADPHFSEHLFAHDADTLGGSSGAPIFDPETGYVIGYHRGYAKGKDLNVATSIERIRPALERAGLWSSLSHCRH